MTVVNATSPAQSLNTHTGGGRQHTIQQGDTLSGIAQQNGVSLSALRAANPQILNPDVIYAGDRVSIPGGRNGGGNGSAPAQQAGTQPAGTTAASSDGSTRLSMADYQRAASALGVDVATVRAVADVESSGGGFLADGRPKILFERHIFARETGGRYNHSHPGISGPAGGYGAGGANQHLRFDQAYALDPAAAMKSASWGEFQIMGFNHRMVGYDTVGQFVEAMRGSAGNQLDAFVQFIESAGLKGALQNKDWAGFARGYNGPAYAQNQYDTKMAAAYARYAGSNPPPVNNPAPTAPAPSPAQGGSYTVRGGDTFSGIAQQHGVSLAALSSANPQIGNINLIHPGQAIRIPGGTNGNPSPVDAGGRIDSPAPVGGGDASSAAQIAQKYLGWWAGDLKVSGHLPMNPNVPNTVNCANFVSAVLQKAGLIDFHTDLVTGSNSGHPQALGTLLMARGWTKVPASQARPGDVAIVNNGHHTELVHSNNNGKITLIGSNNTNGGSGPQKVSYGQPFGNAWYLTPPRG